MLIDRCKGLIRDLSRLRDLRESRNMTEALASRHKQLEEHSSTLLGLTNSMQALASRGLSPALEPQYGKTVLAALHKLAAAAHETPGRWTESGFGREELRNLRRLQDGIANGLRAAWLDYSGERLRGVGLDDAGGLLGVLQRVPSMSKPVAMIRALQQSVGRRAETLPMSVVSVQQFDQELAQLADAWGELRGDGIPEEVLNFLRQAGQGRASLTLVTDTVRAWLRQHQIEGEFHVVVGS